MTNMKRIVITGPTGAIGIAIIEQMIKRGIEVLAICNPLSKRSYRLPESSLIKIIRCDLNDLNKLNLKNNQPYDVFYHLGWKGTVGEERNNTFLQNKNVENALDAVDLAKKLGCHTFIGVGSQAEYGKAETNLKADTATNAQTGYGMAKLCAGMLTRLRCEQIGIRHIWVRVLSVYGPYDNENSMVMSIIRKLLLGESPNTTKGEQLWDYLYSEDAGKALFLLGLYGRDKAIYCLGSGKARPIRDYIQDIRMVINSDIEINFGAIEYIPGQIMYLCADIADLKRDTGFYPDTNFIDGIKKTVMWCKTTMVESLK